MSANGKERVTEVSTPFPVGRGASLTRDNREYISAVAIRAMTRFLADYVSRFREADHADWLYAGEPTFRCARCGAATFSPSICAECGPHQKGLVS